MPTHPFRCVALCLAGALACLPATAPAQTPFTGTPSPLPGVVQAEDFDNGGPGVAFVDGSAGNAGGAYRATDVDIERTGDTGGGFNVGWMSAGEWLSYTVNVAQAGTHPLQARVASNGAGGTFHVEFDGVNRTGPLTIPNTGGWQKWVTLSTTVSLSAGTQAMRVVLDTNGPGGVFGNLNHVSVSGTAPTPPSTSTPFTGTPVALPGIIQAENFDNGGPGVAFRDLSAGNAGGAYRGTDVDLEASRDAGGGYNVGWMSAGEWLNYTVNAAAAGSYTLDVRVASAGAGGTFHVEVGGVDRTGPLTIPNTGGWQAWSTLSKPVTLPAGVQIVRVVLDVNGPNGVFGNLNWLTIKSASAPPPPPTTTLFRQPFLQQVASTSATIVWATLSAGAAEVRYQASGGPVRSAPATSALFARARTGMAADYFQHVAVLNVLAPGVEYAYDVLLDGSDLTGTTDRFRTAPPEGIGTVRFIAFGDSGVGSTAQRQLAARMAADSFDLALHGGDVTYGVASSVGGGTYQTLHDWFFAIYEGWLRSRPIFPSIGNHDDEVSFGQPYRDVFVLPEHGAQSGYADHAERFYSFDYGPVHFVALDTERAFQDPARRQSQLAWLDADLAATAQPWRVVYFHRPPYSSGAEHGSDLAVRQAFGPLFERHGVQLAIAAHDHDYERSTPWRQTSSGTQAVTYVVTGGGGARLYPVGQSEWTANSRSAHHYVRAAVGDCQMQLQAVGLDGVPFDSYTLDRCAQARDMEAPSVQITAPSGGSPLTGTVSVAVSATDDERVEKVDFWLDGRLVAIDRTPPYAFAWDTRTSADGAHQIQARAYDIAGRRASSSRSVQVLNGARTDVVLYPSDATKLSGAWTRQGSTTGAGGQKLVSSNVGFEAKNWPSASPQHFFEMTFNAPAGVEYRLWLRLRAANDAAANDSVWVQFSDAVDSTGGALWRIGTTSGLAVVLEDCSACGVSGWGWQDNFWWFNQSSFLSFSGPGPHTIRVQTREDGVEVDQIVLSSSTYLNAAPGALKDDATIVPK